MIRFKLKERMADKEFRERRRITLIEVATATRIGRITLSRMLKHNHAVQSDTLDKRYVYFECNIHNLTEHVAER